MTLPDLTDDYRHSDLNEAVRKSLQDRDNGLKPDPRHAERSDDDGERIQKLREGFAALKRT